MECAESHHLGSQVVTVSAYESVYYRTGTVIAAPCQVFDKIQFWYVAKVVEGPHKEPSSECIGIELEDYKYSNEQLGQHEMINEVNTNRDHFNHDNFTICKTRNSVSPPFMILVELLKMQL